MASTAPDAALDRPGRHRRFRMARRWLFYVLVRILAAGARRVPRRVSSGFLAALGRLAWRIRHRDRECALRQISFAFPELDPVERCAMGRESFVLFGRNLADAVRDDPKVVIAEEDAARFDRAASSNAPLLVLSLHQGSWEQLGSWLARRLERMGTVTANPHNHWVDAWLRRERAARGLQSFDRRREPLAAARWLRRGRPLAILADHRNQVESVDAEFFGRPAPTAVGPGRLAMRCSARILPVGIMREGEEHRVLVGEAFVPAAHDDERTLAARCNRALEDLIRRAPTQWTWFHDRYASSNAVTPGGEGR